MTKFGVPQKNILTVVFNLAYDGALTPLLRANKPHTAIWGIFNSGFLSCLLLLPYPWDWPSTKTSERFIVDLPDQALLHCFSSVVFSALGAIRRLLFCTLSGDANGSRWRTSSRRLSIIKRFAAALRLLLSFLQRRFMDKQIAATT